MYQGRHLLVISLIAEDERRRDRGRTRPERARRAMQRTSPLGRLTRRLLRGHAM